MSDASIRTAAELARRVLLHLNIAPASGKANPADLAYVGEVWLETRAELTDWGVAYFNSDAIPLAVFMPCVEIVAAKVASSFGRQPMFDWHDARSPARVQLAVHVLDEPTYETLQGNFY